MLLYALNEETYFNMSNKLIRKSSQWKKKGFVIFLGCGKGLIFGTKRVIARKVNKILFSLHSSPITRARVAKLRLRVSDFELKVAI